MKLATILVFLAIAASSCAGGYIGEYGVGKMIEGADSGAANDPAKMEDEKVKFRNELLKGMNLMQPIENPGNILSARLGISIG
jgi:hypothetical protein